MDQLSDVTVKARIIALKCDHKQLANPVGSSHVFHQRIQLRLKQIFGCQVEDSARPLL